MIMLLVNVGCLIGEGVVMWCDGGVGGVVGSVVW